MRKATIKVGKVVQVPVHCFDERRSGWNGWLFQAGIVKSTGVSKKNGKKMALVEYPSRNYAQTLTNVKGEMLVGQGERKVLEKWFYADCIFEEDLFHCKYQMQHPRDYWCNKCYDADTEFLIDKGILK